MGKILIQQVLLNHSVVDVLIDGKHFQRIAPHIEEEGATLIDGRGKAILPPFYNTHGHSAMTLLRGYADDMPLFTWLNEHIWPFEAQMTADDIYIGTKLAIVEMIKSGTVFCSDTYWYPKEGSLAFKESGMRAAVSFHFLDNNNVEPMEEVMEYAHQAQSTSRVQYIAFPHAIYTVSKKTFQYAAQMAREKGLYISTHISETQQEVDDCIKAHGMRPVEWLEEMGILGPDFIAVHAVHLNDHEIDLLKEYGCSVSHNPCSNMKLSSGICRSLDIFNAGINLTIGTDGPSSNNNVDMHEEMKMASLLAKVTYGPSAFTAEEIFNCATQNGAKAFGINAGVIKEGKLADALLIDLNNEKMIPNHHLLSNWVYSADNRAIDTVICDGEIIMQQGKVKDEDSIKEDARRAVDRLLKKIRK